MIYLLLLISGGYIGATLLSRQYPTRYLSELWLSFLPYRIRVGILLCLLLGLTLYVYSQPTLLYVIAGIFICTLFCVGRYWSSYSSFYKTTLPEYASGKLTLFYANIWYKNQYIDELYATISAEDPDMIFLVEYTPTQHETLYPLLKEEYPYINAAYPEKSVGGKVIYSKHPFTNLATTLPGDASWKYGYVSMEYLGSSYVFYLIHTSAPTNRRYFAMRNEQLIQLQDDILSQVELVGGDANIILMGDFNLSPRSYYYARLEASLGQEFTNIVHFFPGARTWSLRGTAHIVRSTIDHIRVTKTQDIASLESVPVLGSDHKGWKLTLD